MAANTLQVVVSNTLEEQTVSVDTIIDTTDPPNFFTLIE